MSEQKNDNSNAKNRWFVMIHHSPKWIETMLLKEKNGEMLEEGIREQRAEPFEFFIPFQFMRPDTTDEVRSLFHNFVFINATAERLRAILSSDWNTTSRYILRFYRNKGGAPITVSDEELRQLKATLLNRQLKVFFGMPVENIGEMAVGDTVTLLIDGWRGRQGKIERVKLKKGRVAMVVAVDILGHTQSVNFEDLHDGDVIFADHDTEQLLTGNLISNIEGPIATMLGHFFRKDNAELKRRDYPRLNRFLSYANIQVDDEDDCRRFTALMLLVATMLGEKGLCHRFAQQLQEWLPSSSSYSLTDAYMLIALFVHTHDPAYRDAAKAYRKSHPDCPAVLRTFINKVRNIQTKRPKEKRGSRDCPKNEKPVKVEIII